MSGAGDFEAPSVRLALALTATEELHHHGADKALCAMCIGVGQGIAMLLEKV